MPKVLTDEQVLHYRANGYLYSLDALSGTEVDSLRSQLAETEDKLGGALDPKYRYNLHILCPRKAPAQPLRINDLEGKSVHNIQAKNRTRSSVFLNNKPGGRLPLQNTHLSIPSETF